MRQPCTAHMKIPEAATTNTEIENYYYCSAYRNAINSQHRAFRVLSRRHLLILILRKPDQPTPYLFIRPPHLYGSAQLITCKNPLWYEPAGLAVYQIDLAKMIRSIVWSRVCNYLLIPRRHWPPIAIDVCVWRLHMCMHAHYNYI